MKFNRCTFTYSIYFTKASNLAPPIKKHKGYVFVQASEWMLKRDGTWLRIGLAASLQEHLVSGTEWVTPDCNGEVWACVFVVRMRGEGSITAWRWRGAQRDTQVWLKGSGLRYSERLNYTCDLQEREKKKKLIFTLLSVLFSHVPHTIL